MPELISSATASRQNEVDRQAEWANRKRQLVDHLPRQIDRFITVMQPHGFPGRQPVLEGRVSFHAWHVRVDPKGHQRIEKANLCPGEFGFTPHPHATLSLGRHRRLHDQAWERYRQYDERRSRTPVANVWVVDEGEWKLSIPASALDEKGQLYVLSSVRPVMFSGTRFASRLSLDGQHRLAEETTTSTGGFVPKIDVFIARICAEHGVSWPYE